MNKGYFLKLTGLSGIGFLASTSALSGFFDNVPPEDQTYIPVCGIYPDPLSMGEKGAHLRWLLPPSRGFPDVITIYRRKAQKDPVHPLFIPSKDNLEKLKEWCGQKDEKGWIKAGEINNANDFANPELIYKRIANPSSYNFYLPASEPGRNARLSQYKELASTYAGIYEALRNPTEDIFFVQQPYSTLQDVPLNELTFRPKRKSANAVKAWNVLQFASIDPNIARMLGFYFVDTGVVTSRDFYDYKIEAYYKSRNETICGVLLQLSKDFSSKPVLQSGLSAAQVDKTYWQFNNDNTVDKQLGKTRLAWPVPAQAINDLQKRYIEPVVYALKKNAEKTKLISPLQENGLFFFDREAIVGSNQYSITGIDLFGQVSNTVTAVCNVTDRDTPPAPTRLSFFETEQNIRLQFEYGGSQYLSAPDANQFRVYKRYDTLNNSAKVKFSLQSGSVNHNSGHTIYTLDVQNASNLSAYRFVSFAEDAAGKKLPAARRKKFRIISSTASAISFLCTLKRFQPPQNGFAVLNKEVNARSADWQQPFAVVTARDPLQFAFVTGSSSYTHFIKNSGDNNHFAGESVNDSKAFTCTAVKALSFTTQKDMFETTGSFTPENFTEILINRSLLFSDMFTGGKVKIGSHTYDIIHQSSGMATPHNINTELNQNPNSKNKYARIIIKNSVSIFPGTSLKVNLKTVDSTQNDTTDKLEGYVILRIQSPITLPTLPGGELLLNASKLEKIDGEVQARDVKIIVRICSDIAGSNTQKEVLVQLDKHIHAISTSSPLLCFYPYQINITDIVRDPAMPLAPGDAFKSVYFAIETLDKSTAAHISALSTTVQFLKVRNNAQRPATPSAPYPCNAAAATRGNLKPADKEGNATFCVQWNGSTNGIRYEVGRALDKTIVAAHKDLWLKGIIDTASPLVVGSVSTNGNVSLNTDAQDSKSGLVPATTTFNLGTIPPENFTGGRLTQQTAGKKTSFEIVNIYRNANTLSLLLRPTVKGILPANAAFTIEQLPSYDTIFNDNQKLAQLANLASATIPDSLGAFSLVTGMPLRNSNQFLDRVPGRGDGRFFYKVRAVDASENRSLWSPASVPIYQTDTSVPSEPVVTFTEGLEQAAYLKWVNEHNAKVALYNVFRTDKKVDPQNSSDYATEKLVAALSKQNPSTGELQISRAKLRYLDNKIHLPLNQTIIEASANVTGVFKLNAQNSADVSFNYLIQTPATFQNDIITGIHPALVNGTEVVVILSTTNADEEIAVYRNANQPLVVSSGQIVMPAPAGNTTHQIVKGIFRSAEYNFGALSGNQTSLNYYHPAGTVFDRDKKTLSGLYAGLQHAEAVAVQITKPGSAPVIIYENPDEYEFVDRLERVLTKELFYNYRLEAVKKVIVNNVTASIRSSKTKDKLILVGMNTPPPVPEIASSVWWDTTGNQPARRSAINTGVKFDIVVADNRGFCVISRLSKTKGIFEMKLTNLASFIAQPNGKFLLSAIDPNPDVNETSTYRVEFVSNWAKKATTVIEIKSL